jgi:hypothetical protein
MSESIVVLALVFAIFSGGAFFAGIIELIVRRFFDEY